MTPLYAVAEIRQTETDAAARLPPGTLMQRAGQAAADLALQMLDGNTVLVLAGPGNNGGDAIVAAGILRRRGLATIHFGLINSHIRFAAIPLDEATPAVMDTLVAEARALAASSTDKDGAEKLVQDTLAMRTAAGH